MKRIRTLPMIVLSTLMYVSLNARADDKIDPVPFDDSKSKTQAVSSDGDVDSASVSDSDGSGPSSSQTQIYNIRSGDTMWDICKIVLDNPWYWPKLWSFNQYILNPNLIYPGNRLAFSPATDTTFPKFEVVKGNEAQTESNSEEAVAESEKPTSSGSREPSFIVEESTLKKGESLAVKLRPISFVSKNDVKTVGFVKHSGEPKMNLTFGDRVYLTFYHKSDVKIGDKFEVIENVKTVYDPDSFYKKIGSMIRKKAYITVDHISNESNWHKRVVEGVIASEDDVVLRGDEIIPYTPEIVSVIPHYTDKDIHAKIVEADNEQFMISNNDFVFLDVGKNGGLQPGLQMYVVRTGDGLFPEEGKDLPDVTIAKIVVVESFDHTSTAYVTTMDRPLEVGDRVKTRVQ